MSDDATINLLDLSLDGLKAFFVERGEKAFRAQQVMKWLHQACVDDVDAMTNIAKSLRETLKRDTVIQAPEIVMHQPSADGTHKWLLRLADGNCIETVFIPEKDRGTLCVSSQVGCALDCTFCSTARQGFNRNLTVAEIIGQLWVARRFLQPEEGVSRVVTNVVMMGMGEPLLNYSNVMTAMNIMLEDNAYGLSKRRVTLSTSGVVPAMYRMFDECDVSLAVSLHAPNDELRDQLVPINKKYPIAELLAACRKYLEGKSQRARVTMEYVCLQGVNDEVEHAHQLANLLKDVPCKVNLIPFNPFPETRYQRSSNNRVHRFQKILMEAGIQTNTRKTRGDDIDAACGQLAGKVQDKSRRTVHFQRIEGGA